MTSSTPSSNSYLPLLDTAESMSGKIVKDTTRRKNTQPTMQSRFEIAALKASHEAYITSLTASFEAEIETLRSESAAEVAALRSHQESALQACQVQQASLSELEKLRSEHAAVVEALKAEHEAEMEEVRFEAAQGQLAALSSQQSLYDHELASIRPNYERQLDLLNDETRKLRRQKADRDVELSDVRGEHSAELSRLRTAHGIELEKQKTEPDDNVKSLRKQLKQERTTGSGRFIELHFEPIREGWTQGYKKRTFIFSRTDTLVFAMERFGNCTAKPWGSFTFEHKSVNISTSTTSKGLAQLGFKDGDVVNFRLVSRS